MSRWAVPLRRRGALVALICLGVAATFMVLLHENRNDDAFITYRHSQNLLAGEGFVFNPGERVLVTTAPFHGLLIAATGLVWPDLVFDAMILSWLSAALLGWVIWRLLAAAGRTVAGGIAAATVLFSPFTYEVAPLETLLVTSLCWAFLLAWYRERRWLSGLAAGLAMGVRADAALWVLVVLAADFLAHRQIRRLLPAVTGAGLILAPWFAVAWWYYGSPLSITAEAKTGWEGHLWFFVGDLWDRCFSRVLGGPVGSIPALALALVGFATLFRREELRHLRIVPVWLVTYIGVYSALRIFWPHHWYYYPLTVGLMVLFAVGAAETIHRLREKFAWSHRGWVTIGAVGIFLAALAANIDRMLAYRAEIPTSHFVGARHQMYREVAEWLRENTSDEKTVAIREPGTVAFYSDRPVIDMMGLVTPSVGREMKRRGIRAVSIKWTKKHFDPDVFVIVRPPHGEAPFRLPPAPSYTLRRELRIEGAERGMMIYAREAESQVDSDNRVPHEPVKGL